VTNETGTPLDDRLLLLLELMAGEGIHRAAEGLATMVGEEVTITRPKVVLVRLVELADTLGGAESEGVGIYLQVVGEIPGQVVMIVPYAKALELADLVLGVPEGTSQELGSLERSALAEVGNLTAAFFLNAVASMTGLHARPSPPAVMVDMLGAILDIVIATTEGIGDSLLLLDASFLRAGREVQARFCMIPDPKAIELIASRSRDSRNA